MKKYLLRVLLLLSITSAWSQPEKGTIVLGGATNGNLNILGDLSFDLRTEGGYFVMDRIAVGLILGISRFEDFGGYNSDFLGGMSVGIYGKHWFLNGAYLVSNFREQDFDVIDDGTEGFIEGQLGYMIFISDNVVIDPALNYSRRGRPSISVGLKVFL